MGKHTVGYYAKEKSSKFFLLCEILPGWDPWSVGMSGPGWSPRVRHGSDVCDTRDYSKWWVR